MSLHLNSIQNLLFLLILLIVPTLLIPENSQAYILKDIAANQLCNEEHSFCGSKVDIETDYISNTTYVAYAGDVGAGFKLYVEKYSNNSWKQIGDAVDSTLGLENFDLAIDPLSGTLYIAYTNTYSFKATVKKYNGSTWELVGTQEWLC